MRYPLFVTDGHPGGRKPRTPTRRSFLRGSAAAFFVTVAGGVLAACGGGVARREVPLGSFGGKIPVEKDQIPAPGGEPVLIPGGRFWLLNLKPGEGDIKKVGGAGGLIALYTKCPHAGCQVPWQAEFDGANVNQPGIIGWFRCPCHLSTFSRAGILVSGPSSRPMSTMPITVLQDGSLHVDTSKITAGLAENPKRTVPYAG
ncbi:MAG: hypothetical protein C0506_11405 [Anaerolinea sp.]|nr:hypothetical protein [Anaerolinea sp.]